MPQRFHSTKPIVALLALLALACSVELALRASGFEYPPAGERHILWNRQIDRAMRDGTSSYRCDDAELWSPRPGARVPWSHGERINHDGYRGPAIPVSRAASALGMPPVLRIVALGGSAACGRGVAYDDAYPAQLERVLARHGVRCEVQYGAVENTTIAQGLERYRRLFRKYKPDIVISAFSGDEEHDPAPSAISDARRMASRRATAKDFSLARTLRRECRLVQLPIWIARTIDGSYWEERAYDFEARRNWDESAWTHSPIVRRVAPDEFEEALRVMDQEVWRDGAHLILVSIPRTLDARSYCDAVQAYDDALRDFSDRHNVTYVSCRDLVRCAMSEGASPANPLSNSEHAISECIHERLGEALAQAILVWQGDVAR